MKKKNLFYVAFALTFVLGSCSDEMFDNAGQVNEPSSQTTRAADNADWSKAYVLCEGTWKQDPPSSPGRLITYDNNWVGIDTLEIGDTGNDLIQYGSKLYCAVSGHDLTYGNGGIWVFNAATGAPYGEMKQYDDEKSHSKAMPRRLAAYGGMVYISLYSGAVMAIDTTNFEKERFIELDATYSEGICVANNTVYVCNSGNTGDAYAGQGTTISKLPLNLSAETQVTVPINPKLIAQAPDGTIYFNSLGDYSTISSGLYTLDGNTSTLVTNQVSNFGMGNNELYTVDVDWTTYETVFQKVTYGGGATPFNVKQPAYMLGYSITVNPFTNDVCVGQTGQNLYIYTASGTGPQTIETGTANPNTVVFVK